MSKSCNCLSETCSCTKLQNEPGLDALSYRVSTYGKSRDRMFKLISQTAFEYTDLNDPTASIKTGAAPLANLTTRDTGDLSIALIDSWAIACDVLSFYQERIINEGYLRTATERRSVLELAREIGYELAPGVSASTYLAYIVESSPLSPRVVTVPKGSAVQSVPQKEEAPQTFEVSEDTEVRVNWNAVVPQMSTRQVLAPGLSIVLIEGPVSLVARGDFLLIQPEGANPLEVRKVLENTFVSETNTTTLQLEPIANPTPYTPPLISGAQFAPSYRDFDLFNFIEESTLQGQITERGLNYEELELVAQESRDAMIHPAPGVIPSKKGDLPVGVYIFKYRTNNFGHNAPPYETLPGNLRLIATNAGGKPIDEAGNLVSPRFKNGTYDACSISMKYDIAWPSKVDFYLERSIPDLRIGEPILLQNSAELPKAFQITKLSEDSVAEYMMSGKSTGVNVVSLPESIKNDSTKFLLRTTTILAGASSLQLAVSPILDDIAAGVTKITLDTMITGLRVGNVLAITGEAVEQPGVIRVELATIKLVTHQLGLTTVEFEDPLQNGYIRSTVRMNANLVPANHGATVPDEILGSGDASKIHQSFSLKKKPLTYISSSDPSGSTSTLEVRVNGVLWRQVRSLYSSGPNDKVYCVQISDDGVVSVKFGDGKRGSRLPTGTYNIVARYREGIGTAGLVPATTLTLPKRKPLGIRSIANPTDATGGVDPESRDEARTNAPSTVLTMERIVSRKDLEDFARAFAGVGKSSAVEVNNKQTQLLLLTVGSSEEGPFDLTSEAFKNLTSAIKLATEPSFRVQILTYAPKQFEVDADVQIDAAYVAADVIATVKSALTAAFNFSQRQFGESVSLAEVMATIQRVPGVLMVDINILGYSLATATTAPRLLEAKKVEWAATGSQMAELLTINPYGLQIREVKP